MAIAFRASRDVILRTARFDEAIRFYAETLGLPVVHRSATLFGFDAGALRLYVERGADHGLVLDFLVSDGPAARHGLLAAGCEIFEEDASVPRCYFRDPFGLVFNLEERQGGA